MLKLDNIERHIISSPDSFFVNELKSLNINIFDTGYFHIYDIQKSYIIIIETCRQNDDTYEIDIVLPGNALSLQIKKVMTAENQIFLHQHSCIEIMYVISGSVTNHTEDQIYTYNAGQFCVMNKNIHHCEEITGDFQAVFFMVKDEFMMDLINERDKMLSYKTEQDNNPVFQLVEDSFNKQKKFDKEYIDYFPLTQPTCSKKMESIIRFIIEEARSHQDGSTFFVKGAFSRMLSLMNDSAHFSINRIRSDFDSHKFIFNKVTHILRSSHGRCSRSDLSTQMHYNDEYLNRIIKKYTGKTILEYGRSICLEEAEQLIRTTDKSISSIIEDLGFSNRHHFYNLFKNEYNMTPLEYRQHFQQ